MATTYKNVNIPTHAYHPRADQKTIEVAWSMAADAQSCVVYLYAARRGGDVVLAYTTTLTAGKQVSTGSRYYIDTIAAGTETWNTDIVIIDGGGNDRMSRITLDTCGYDSFFCLYTGLSSENVEAYFSGY